MGVFRWIVGGFAGATIGILIWVAVGYFTQYEVGWIAWGIGFLVGVGVRYGAHLGDQDEGVAQGILASCMAIGAIVTAKFLLFSTLVSGVDAERLRELADLIRYDQEAMVASIADEIAEEMMDRGATINWPPGMTYEEAFRQADYPPELWQQAELRWNQLGAQEQQERTQQRRMLATMLSSVSLRPDFSDFFSPWDLLWFALATITAYRIGVGTYGDD